MYLEDKDITSSKPAHVKDIARAFLQEQREGINHSILYIRKQKQKVGLELLEYVIVLSKFNS